MPNRTNGSTRSLIQGSFQSNRIVGFLAFTVMSLGSTLSSGHLHTPSSSLTTGDPTTTNSDTQSPRNHSAETADRIDELIANLGGPDYAQREFASNELVKIGHDAIGPLAFRSLECPPESCWRIKKILERISTNGNEEVFYKAAGILQLRYDGGNKEMSLRLAQLKYEWQEKRKSDAITTLRNHGVIVNDTNEHGLARAGNAPLLLRGNVVILEGNGINLIDFIDEPTHDFNTSKNRTDKATGTLTQNELKEKITQILESDIRNNRDRILGNAGQFGASNNNADRAEINRQIIRNQIQFRGELVRPNSGQTGVVVEFTKNWKQNRNDFKLLFDIADLNEIKFSNQDLRETEFATLAGLANLTQLSITDCNISADAMRRSDWQPSLQQLEFSNLAISTELIEACASIPALQILTFNQCKFGGTTIDSLADLDALQGIDFKGMNIANQMLESLAGLTQIRYINLSACKFQTQAFLALKLARPKLEISYAPRALLGVRGPINYLDEDDAAIGDGCPITDVVPGSGADKAGMKVGDLIKTIDGNLIKSFEDIRLEIAQHEPGKTVDVIVIRAGENKTLKVTLTGNDSVQSR